MTSGRGLSEELGPATPTKIIRKYYFTSQFTKSIIIITATIYFTLIYETRKMNGLIYYPNREEQREELEFQRLKRQRCEEGVNRITREGAEDTEDVHLSTRWDNSRCCERKAVYLQCGTSTQSH